MNVLVLLALVVFAAAAIIGLVLRAPTAALLGLGLALLAANSLTGGALTA